MTISYDFAKIASLVDQNTLILTPNARTQKAVYAGQISAIKDDQVIQSLDVRSLSQWQSELWSELSFIKILPKRVTNLTLKSSLEKQVKQEAAWTLTNSSGVAAKALEAFQNLVHWNLRLHDVQSEQATEIEYFLSWGRQLTELCESKNIIPEFQSLQLLIENIDLISSLLPEKILLVGFNQFTPLQKKFLEKLGDIKIIINHFELQVKPKKMVQHVFNHFSEELDFAANYAKQFAEHECSVAIVVENLAGNLDEVHRVFSRVFHPLEHKPWVAIDKPRYNVSAGYTLIEQPIVKAAMKLLALKPHQLSIEDLHFIKNSAFISWGENGDAIHKFLYQLCLSPRKQFTTTHLIKQIEENDEPYLLDELKERLLAIQEHATISAAISHHMVRWRSILKLWGWANEDRLVSYESQAKSMFNSCVNDCSALSDLYQKVTAKESFDYLKQLIQTTSFQMASDRTNIHVLGVLEASGLQFDHLILVGFNSSNWPQKNAINPFLPLALQREHNMPGNSAEREFEYAGQLSSALLKGASYITATVSPSDSETAVPASFFSQLNRQQSDFTSDENRLPEPEPDYQWLQDNYLNINSESVKGGAYLLSDYAKCPFKSMANFQMNLTAYQPPDIGIEPRIKGTWLHDAMEIIWTEISKQSELLNLSPEALNLLVENALSTAMKKHHAYLLAVTDAEIVELERSKLSSLIKEWLTLEKQRDDFKIFYLEEPLKLNLASIQFKFRVDRVDEVAGERLTIIDYKTGKTDVKQWFGVRPNEAQMPAYILAMKNKPISGLNYARIKTGEVGVSGIQFSQREPEVQRVEQNANELKYFPIKEMELVSFNQLVKQWEMTLGRIATGIGDGYMAVSPKDKNATCNYCDYQSVCRINESQPESWQDSETTETRQQDAKLIGQLSDDIGINEKNLADTATKYNPEGVELGKNL